MTTEQKYEIIKVKHSLKDRDIAAMFGYKNVISFLNSARKSHVVTGVVELYEKVNGEIV